VSRMCCAYLELGLCVRIACMCSLYRVRNFLPVCPMYFCSQPFSPVYHLSVLLPFDTVRSSYGELCIRIGVKKTGWSGGEYARGEEHQFDGKAESVTHGDAFPWPHYIDLCLYVALSGSRYTSRQALRHVLITQLASWAAGEQYHVNGIF
jgi:hypothetical protein